MVILPVKYSIGQMFVSASQHRIQLMSEIAGDYGKEKIVLLSWLLLALKSSSNAMDYASVIQNILVSIMLWKAN